MRQARISEPAAISRDGSILGVIFRSNFRGTSRSAPPWRHAPAHRHHLGLADDRRGTIGKYTGHWRQIADVAVDHPEEGGDRGLVGGDAVEIAHLFPNFGLHADFPFPAFTDISGGPITPTLRKCPARASARNPILADGKRRIST